MVWERAGGGINRFDVLENIKSITMLGWLRRRRQEL